MEGKSSLRILSDRQLFQQPQSLRVAVVTADDIFDPGRLTRGNGLQGFSWAGAREGIGGIVFRTFLVLDAVLQPEELRKSLLLPWGCQSLCFKMDQTPLVNVNHEFSMLEVWSPLVYRDDDSQVFFFVS